MLLTTFSSIIILLIDNRNKSIVLFQVEQKLNEKEIEIHAMTWSITRHYKFCNNCKLNESIMANKMDIFHSNSSRIYYKFSLTDCETCIETELDNIKRISIPISILIESYSNRNFRQFIQMHQLDPVNTFCINNPLLEVGEEPFYFVVSEERIREMFFPVKENPDFSIEFLNIMQNKYSI